MNDVPARSSSKRRHRIHPNARRAQPFVPWPSATACGISAVAIAFSGSICWALHQEIRRQRTVEARPDEFSCCPGVQEELLPLPNRSSVDPCLDLHEFVCRRQGARRSNIFRRAYANVLLDWAAIFHSTGNSHLENHLTMIKTLYRSCMPVLLEAGEAERQAATFLDQWGDVWKTIRDNPTSHDLTQAVLNLSLTYNISTVLDVKLTLALNGTTAEARSNVVRIIITPGPDLCSLFQRNRTFCDESSVEILRWLNKYMVLGLGEASVDEIFQLQSVLRLVGASVKGQTARKSIYEVAGAIGNMTGEVLKEQISRAIPARLHLFNIDDTEASDTAVLAKLMEQFLRPDRKKAAWVLLMLHSFAVLAHRVFPINTSLRSLQQMFVDCDLHATTFGHLRNLVITEAVDSSRRSIEADAMISQIRSAVRRGIQTSYNQSWTAASGLSQLHLYYPRDTVPRLAHVPNMSENYFDNAFRARRYEQSAHLERIATRSMSLFSTRSDSGLVYVAHESTMFISLPSLATPLFLPDSVRFVNYARIGALVAGELYGSVLGDPTPDQVGNNETKSDGFPTAQKGCFEKLYFGNSIGSIKSTGILDRVLSLSLGLVTVWEIVQDDLLDRDVVFEGRGEVVTRAQMFFLRYCATWCGYYESDDWNRWSCNVPVQNLMAFHAAFECPAPVARCLQ